MSTRDVRATVSSTQEYYDGPADEIYRNIWQDNIHLGVPCGGNCPHPEAMEHTNEIMAKAVNLGPNTRVIDLGCGYGSTARYLARNYGCPVVGTNISRKELDLANERAKAEGLNQLAAFEYGDFHDIQYPEASFDVVWSQESFLHGADKEKIIAECKRVLVPGGTLIFTDILVRKGTSQEDRARIYDRVKSPDMWDLEDYKTALEQASLQIQQVEDWSQYVARSYGWVRDRVKENREALLSRAGEETVDRTIDALSFWVDSANAGKIGWGLFVAKV